MITELMPASTLHWVKAAPVTAFPADGGACVKVGTQQIAVFQLAQPGSTTSRWYATQNECPHKAQMVLARGLVGDHRGEPKVACPFHKKAFSLESGRCLTDEPYQIATYPVEVLDGYVYIGLPA